MKRGLLNNLLVCICVCICSSVISAQSERSLSGVVVTPSFEAVPEVLIEVRTAEKTIKSETDSEGKFSIIVPQENISVTFSGKGIRPLTKSFTNDQDISELQIRVSYIVPPIAARVTITDETLGPQFESRNSTIYDETLFGRDDQLILSLNAGINAGQHEGGGKSLEIRRYGFNTDHGGVGGGVKILVDNVQQNQSTQGHGQGYLGSLKSVSPELVETVSIINGPFSAAYGDFSGLGVVKINLKESLPDELTARVQTGSHNTFRGFIAYSPKINNIDSFISYEPSYTDGPFESPLNYRRDNVSGNFTYKFDENQAVGLKLNIGRNNYNSSGQIPLDLVASGALDRFGFLDRDNGGNVQSGTVNGYYRKSFDSGTTFKADAFISRSLFDLYSNFTFFLTDPVYGDEIQQHDSRLQEGANFQVFQPFSFSGNPSLLTFGGNIHFNQINVGLYPTVDRNPNRKFLPENINNPDILLTSAQANVNNYAGYVQSDMNFFDGHVRLEAGLRWDYFSFDVNGFELSDTEFLLNGRESTGKFQPKIGISWSPFETAPISFYGNYGRGISSQDARGVVRNSNAPKVATTDFYQFGASYNSSRFSAVFSSFLIDRSNEQVYIPDDGTIEFSDPSRSYGVEVRASAKITDKLSFNGGLTQVLQSYFRNTEPRVFVDSAPKTVTNGGLVVSDLEGFNLFLNWRHISNYRLDGIDSSIRASGHDVVDFSMSKRLKSWVDANLSIDNLFNKKYFETQNFFESRVSPNAPIAERIHATPGYSTTVSFGLTFRLGRTK